MYLGVAGEKVWKPCKGIQLGMENIEAMDGQLVEDWVFRKSRV